MVCAYNLCQHSIDHDLICHIGVLPLQPLRACVRIADERELAKDDETQQAGQLQAEPHMLGSTPSEDVQPHQAPANADEVVAVGGADAGKGVTVAAAAKKQKHLHTHQSANMCAETYLS